MPLLLTALLATLPIDDPPTAWPGFLGARATEVRAAELPLAWTPESGAAWTADLPGQGQSSPIIWGEQVYATSIDGTMKDTCHVTAVDLADGKVAWTWSTPSSQPVRSNYFQSRSAPTPVADAEGVCAFFETGDVVALDHQGEEIWRRSLVEDYGEFESTIGLASSPLLVDGKLILLIDHEGPSYLLALDRATGETAWMTERDSRKSYSSPLLASIGGRIQIVCSADGSVDGYDPADGRRLWTFDQVGGNTSCSPLSFGDGRLLIGASAGMHGEREADARKSNVVLAIDQIDGEFRPRIVWSADKAMPTFASPMVHQGLAYWVNRVGVVFCFDAETGEPKYSERIAQSCWATPIGIDDRIYFFGKDGVTSVIAAGPEFRLLSENTLWDPEKVEAEPLARRRAAGGGASTHNDGDHAEHRDGSGEAAGGQPEGAGRQEGAGRPEGSGRPGAAGRPEAAGRSDGTGAPPAGQAGAPSGRPAPGSQEEAAMREAMAGVFADPVQYGVAIVPGSIVIRTGTKLHCLR